MTIRKQALDAVANGLAIIPTKDKRPMGISQDNPLTTVTAVEGHWYAMRKEMPPVAVVSEACEVPLMFLDIDVKNGVNGYESLRNAGLDIPESPIRYTSSGGNGEHIWFRAPKESLGKVTSRGGITVNGVKLAGVDNRIGNGFVVLPANFEVPSREVLESLPIAPEWLWKESLRGEKTEATRYEGSMNEWLEQKAQVTSGDLAPEVQAIKNSIPFVMDHDIVRDLQAALVREGAKGTKGAVEVLVFLKKAWLRDEFDTAEYRNDWDILLEGAIEKYGSPVEDVQHGGYFTEKGQFLAYEFAQDMTEDTAIDAAGAFWTYADGVWSYNPSAHVARLSSELKNSYRVAHSSLVSDHLQSMLTVQGQVIKDEPHQKYINLSNGMYNWEKNSLVPHDKHKMSTVQLSFAYDSQADCPNFDKWLSETMPGNEQLALEVMGYMMLNGNPKHKAILLVGGGRNGKSTFLRVIQNMIGQKNYSSLTLKQLSTERFAPVAMYGKLANIAGDIHEGHLNDSTTFKAITGLDPIQAERKGQQGFTFTPWATLIFSTNSLWSSSDTTDGYLERWLPVPFTQKFDANGQFNEAELFAEVAGIFNKAMEAYRAMELRGGKFSTSEAQQELVQKFRENADTTLQWLNNEDYIKVNSPENELVATKRTDVYESYKHSRRGKFTLSPTELYQDLERKGYKSVTRKGYKYIIGIECHIINSFGELSHYEAAEVNF